MGLEAILALVGTLGGMILPPVVDFLKKKFIPASNDTPERTMGTLATTKPETLAPYVASLATYLESQVKFFNRDVVGTPSTWVVNLRAAIRPLAVVGSFLILGLELFSQLAVDPGTRAALCVVIGNWIGSRVTDGELRMNVGIAIHRRDSQVAKNMARIRLLVESYWWFPFKQRFLRRIEEALLGNG